MFELHCSVEARLDDEDNVRNDAAGGEVCDLDIGWGERRAFLDGGVSEEGVEALGDGVSIDTDRERECICK